jgi:hypothetical protein
MGPMFDNETIAMRDTVIGGKRYPDDYTVFWRGLPIGRIRKSPDLPAHIDQWWWGCNVYGQPSLSRDNGPGTAMQSLNRWARMRARLTDRERFYLQPKPRFQCGDPVVLRVSRLSRLQRWSTAERCSVGHGRVRPYSALPAYQASASDLASAYR